MDRMSFADTLAWMCHAVPGEAMPRLLVNPLRPDRLEPRALKRRPKEYDRLNKPRAQMREALRSRGDPPRDQAAAPGALTPLQPYKIQ